VASYPSGFPTKTLHAILLSHIPEDNIPSEDQHISATHNDVTYMNAVVSHRCLVLVSRTILDMWVPHRKGGFRTITFSPVHGRWLSLTRSRSFYLCSHRNSDKTLKLFIGGSSWESTLGIEASRMCTDLNLRVNVPKTRAIFPSGKLQR
jgi:hypothetical protein